MQQHPLNWQKWEREARVPVRLHSLWRGEQQFEATEASCPCALQWREWKGAKSCVCGLHWPGRGEMRVRHFLCFSPAFPWGVKICSFLLFVNYLIFLEHGYQHVSKCALFFSMVMSLIHNFASSDTVTCGQVQSKNIEGRILDKNSPYI